VSNEEAQKPRPHREGGLKNRVGTRSYILGKVLQALLTLAFVVVFNFFLFRVIPPDPLELYSRITTPLTPPNVE
jgi:hypothetical protein